MDLFSALEQHVPKEFEKRILNGGEVWIMKNFIDSEKASWYFNRLSNSIHWKQEQITFYGKTYPVPRKTAWYGYEGFNYSYSGINCNPDAWTPDLLEIKRAIEAFLPDQDFNSVLLNLYRDGNDKVSWHADDEKELGLNPTIASVSFGATRHFDLKHKSDPELKTRIELLSGSLVVMTGALQHNWQHQIPVQKTVKEPRINLTFRTIKI